LNMPQPAGIGLHRARTVRAIIMISGRGGASRCSRGPAPRTRPATAPTSFMKARPAPPRSDARRRAGKRLLRCAIRVEFCANASADWP
jgi:hypothetical protein